MGVAFYFATLRVNRVRMDPDAIFIIFLFIVFLVLLIINTIALIKKIARTKWPVAVKIIIPVLLMAFLVWAPWYFTNTVHTSGEVSPYELLMGAGAMIIGLNWSLNIARSMRFRSVRISRSMMVILLTLAFTILLPLSLYLLGHLFDSMNIMGSGS
jgi:hypothetical protein